MAAKCMETVEQPVLPENLERAKVILIPKGNPRDENEYRPICRISVAGKRYEAIIKGRLEK